MYFECDFRLVRRENGIEKKTKKGPVDKKKKDKDIRKEDQIS